MFLWKFFQGFIFLTSFASSASPPGSPKSEGSSTGLLIDNPHSEYFHASPTLHFMPTGKVAETQVIHDKKSKSPSPTLTQSDRISSPKIESTRIQNQLLTDPTSEYYNYFRLLAPKEHFYANNAEKEKPTRKRKSTTSVYQSTGEATSSTSKKRGNRLTDEEKIKSYEKRLEKQRLLMAERRKKRLSGEQDEDYLRQHRRAVSSWRQRKKVQDPNYFKAKHRFRKFREKLEDQFGIRIPREKGGRPRKDPIPKKSPTKKQSDKSS